MPQKHDVEAQAGSGNLDPRASGQTTNPVTSVYEPSLSEFAFSIDEETPKTLE
jgi:hypothetical protein